MVESERKKCEAMLIGPKHAVDKTQTLQIVLIALMKKTIKQSDYTV